jgi:uracil phosphoribosyltransferase
MTSAAIVPRAPEATRFGGWEIEHCYGERVHILHNLHLLTLLARLSSKDARHPEMVGILRTVYRGLLITAAGNEFPASYAEVPTRMAEHHPEHGVYRGPVVDPKLEVVVVDVIRAGIVPSQVCFEMLSSILRADNVRLDHVTMSRVSDDEGRVIGVDLSGSKIGGRVDGAIMILPDPMGATGATTVRAVHHYMEHWGTPGRIIAMPMIVTPEYLQRVTHEFENLVVYSARLDRGLSAPDVLASVPGTYWGRERGLDDNGYIVPGAGGMGEVLNNSWC